MAPHKVVVKCGSYAVLVELQIIGPLGRGAPQETSWFTMEHTEEVTSLVRDAVDRRVRLYIDCLHKRGQPKHKRELPRANPLCVKGRRVSLVANFVKRHFNLRCIVKHQYGELRVFPERYVVCVSRLEDASANPTPAVIVSQSTESQYFSRPAAETRDELNSSTITKRSSLQKIARHAHARPRPETQPLPCGSVLGKKLQSEQNRVPGEQVPEPQPPTDQPRLTTDALLPHGHPTTSTDPRDTVLSQSQSQGGKDEPSRVPGDTDPRDTVLSQSQSQGGEDEPNRVPGDTDPRDTVLSQGEEDEPSRVPGDTDPRDTVLSQSQSQGEEPSRVSGEDAPRAKRVCLGPLLVACSSNDLITPTHSAESSNPLLPPPPPPPLSSPRPPVVKSSAKMESEAFPAPLSPLPAPERTQSTAPLSPLPAPERTQSQTSQTTVEVELLTPGKQSQSLLPLTSSNNTEQTNQNSPAAGLRGRSVKDVVSSALSIASTYISVIGEGEEGRENGGRRRRRGEEKRREGRGREEKRGKIMEGKRGEEREYNGGDKSRRGEEREVGEEERSVARPSRLRRLKR